ncbi:MAG: hypothetical protein LBK73_13790 [Treponema sp.]|nr:hypothetical protein [Treponema sp.]
MTSNALSEIMRWIKRNSRTIKGMRDFLRVRKYIAEKPVKAGIVERAAERVFGSLYHRR